MNFEVSLVSIQHSIKPWKELLSTMIGMQDNRDSIGRSNSTDVKSASNGTSDASFLILVVNALALLLGAALLLVYLQNKQRRLARFAK